MEKKKKNIIALVVIIVIIYLMLPTAGIEIANPLKKNIEFNVLVDIESYGGVIPFFYIRDVSVETRRVGLLSVLSVQPKQLSWFCAPIVGPGAELYVELYVPGVGYRQANRLKVCAEDTNTRFVVGFTQPGQYSYTIRIYRDRYPGGDLEYQKEYNVYVQ